MLKGMLRILPPPRANWTAGPRRPSGPPWGRERRYTLRGSKLPFALVGRRAHAYGVVLGKRGAHRSHAAPLGGRATLGPRWPTMGSAPSLPISTLVSVSTPSYEREWNFFGLSPVTSPSRLGGGNRGGSRRFRTRFLFRWIQNGILVPLAGTPQEFRWGGGADGTPDLARSGVPAANAFLSLSRFLLQNPSEFLSDSNEGRIGI